MKSPSTVKPPSNHRHDGVTVIPSPALYERPGDVTVAENGGKVAAQILTIPN
jgi:hypothetical protein